MLKTPSIIAMAAILCGLTAGCTDTGVTADPADPDKPAKPAVSEFLRFVEDGEYGGRLETAVATYVDPAGRRVDLIGAVHVAEPEYFEMLQTLFASYDALLFEMIAPSEDYRPRQGEHGDNILSNFQRNFCNLLGLEFQLDGVNYNQPNFVHADLTAGEFRRIWRERGETPLTMFFRIMMAQFEAMGDGMGQSMTGDAMIDAFRSADSASRLKLLFAREMQHVETMFARLDPIGSDGEHEGKGSMIIGERNKAAIRALEEQLEAGQKRLGIFYGAAHMPDMEIRLKRDLGFELKRHTWVTAWEIVPKAPTGEDQ
jgi:hypothetical protein